MADQQDPDAEPADSKLIEQARDGSSAAYEVLYERHRAAAAALAKHLAGDAAQADDLVSEAFTNVLHAIRGNGGPTLAFRPYLLATVRNVANEHYRRNRKVSFVDDVSMIEPAHPAPNEAMSHAERYLIADAYRRLPDRWRQVLWYSEVEGHSPAAIAPMLGLSANGVSALTYRAREGLRQAYLQAHLASAATARCRAATDRLGAWARSGLSQRERAQVEAHLDGCMRCRSLAAGLTDLNSALPAVVATAVLGAAGLGYLATVKATAGAATAAARAHAGIATVKTAYPQLIGAVVAGVALAGVVVLGSTAGGPSPAPVATSEPTVTRSTTPAPAVPLAPATSSPAPPPPTPRPSGAPTKAPPAKRSPAAPIPHPASTTPPSAPTPSRTDLTLSTVVSADTRGGLMLSVKVGNSGPAVRPAAVEVTVPAGVAIESYRGPCVPAGGRLRCPIVVIPQSWLTLRVWLDARPATRATAAVTLTAGARTLVARPILAFPG